MSRIATVAYRETTSIPPAGTSTHGTLNARLAAMHHQIRHFCPAVERLAVALYEPTCDQLHTFLDSTRGHNPLTAYSHPLTAAPSLLELARTRHARVLNDLGQALAADPASDHSLRLLAAGYRASYTAPLFSGERLLGFLFLDASHADVFTPAACARLEVYVELVALVLAQEQASIHTLSAAIRTAIHFGRLRDEETGDHLMRMAHYAQIIARHLPAKLRPDDEAIEFLLLFAPLHDIGKIAIPDHVLRKPGPLDAAEMALMRTHVDLGHTLVADLITEFELDHLDHVDMLRNIVRYHHENYDGSGYNSGRAGADIPLEARIVKVADVFDALTSARPYKAPWPLAAACDFIAARAGREFDPHCAAALLGHRDEAADIRARFAPAAGRAPRRPLPAGR